VADFLSTNFLQDAVARFNESRSLGDRAIAQVTDEDFFKILDPESNSIALIVKHIAGNMRSRWTDFLTSDGEKPDRNRDSEFVITPEDTKGSLMARWDDGWELVTSTVSSLAQDDLLRIVTIRAQPHTVLQAIHRQTTHYAYHVGQIVFLAKHLAWQNWSTLSVPRNQSDALNRRMMNPG